MEANLTSIIKHSNHPCSSYLTKLVGTYPAGISAHDAIMKYKGLGEDAAQRIRRDVNHTNLASAGRYVVAFLKQSAGAAEALKDAKKDVAEDAPALISKCLEIVPGKAGEYLLTPLVAESICWTCKEFAGKIKEVLGRLKGVAKGFEVGGENDWKVKIENPGDLSGVLAAASTSLAKVEGNVLGERIKEMEEAIADSLWGLGLEDCVFHSIQL